MSGSLSSFRREGTTEYGYGTLEGNWQEERERIAVGEVVIARRGLPKWPKMCPSVARIGCKPKSRNEAVASGSGSCPVPLRCMPASHRASDDVEHDSGLTLSTPLRRPPMRLKSCCRRDDHRSCYDVRSGPPPDHPVHSAARRDHVVISTVIALRCRW